LTTGSNGGPTLFRLREGIERFFITDINNPAGASKAQSEIPVQFDTFGADYGDGGNKDPKSFNHIPGGCNVLYLDGHVAFVRYEGGPEGNYPITEFVAWWGLGGTNR
jgi:prepilin-type processing-associated H-X9-DG protein